VDLKDELADTAIQITCYDRNGEVVKRVTSTSGEVEDPENENGENGTTENGNNESTENGSQNQGGNTGSVTPSGDGGNTGGNGGNTGGNGDDDDAGDTN
jgi:hypothetical protein